MIKTAKSVHFIGIGGIGMSAIARICLGMGKKVSGSDMRKSLILDELGLGGADVKTGHSKDNILLNSPQVVVYSQDITENSPGFIELECAKENNIPCITYAQALGQLASGHFTLAVTGTNGKSTTTALLALMMEEGGMDPSVVVGSKISLNNTSEKFKANARLGSGKYFIAEADEYHRHMMELSPNLTVITNVSEDHLDYYADLNEIKSAFGDFVGTLPPDGTLVFNADDHATVEVGRKAPYHKLTFGIHHYADMQALNVGSKEGEQSFDMHYKNENLGRVVLKMPGIFNVSNALAASLAALKMGVEFADIKKVLQNFAGIWRRFERVGKFEGMEIISDYAHHPAAVKGTIKAAYEFYPDKRILFVFQPHHRNRTKKLFGEFSEALSEAQDLALVEIFDVAGREHGETISSSDLQKSINSRADTNVSFCPALDDAESFIREQKGNFDVAVFMGAGDIDLLARKLTGAK
jgi:UDP-N-acetylmuramate--alanine ligase